jgi:hypothetical protein
MLSFCLEYARLEPGLNVGGVFETIREKFERFNKTRPFDRVQTIRNFRKSTLPITSVKNMWMER